MSHLAIESLSLGDENAWTVSGDVGGVGSMFITNTSNSYLVFAARDPGCHEILDRLLSGLSEYRLMVFKFSRMLLAPRFTKSPRSCPAPNTLFQV